MLRRFLSALLVTVRFAALVAACGSSAAIAADSSGAAPYHVGAATRVFHPEVARNWRGARTEALVTRIWYPVDPTIPQTSHANGDSLFQAHPFASDAALSPAHARYPLLVLSHGTGGSAESLDWLAAALAANGYIVAGVNHPGNNALEPVTLNGFLLWWERATDLSEVLDGVLADPVLGAHIDTARIGAVGFSLGGYTVLELAGARTDLKRFQDFCTSPAADAICHPPEMKRIKGGPVKPASFSPEMTASMARSGASYRDPRVKAVFAIAPALGEAFDKDAFASVDIPISLTAGSDDPIAPIATNIQRIASLMPNAKVSMVPGALHNTFLDTCVPAMMDQAGALCNDGPGVDRDAVHAQTVERALAFFNETLPARTQ